MLNNYYSMQLMLEMVSLCLSIFLIYNNSVYKLKKGIDVLTIQTLIVFLTCLLDVGLEIAQNMCADQYLILLDGIELFSVSLHLLIYISVIELFYESISYAPQLSKKTRVLSLMGVLVISLIVGWVLEGSISFWQTAEYAFVFLTLSVNGAEKVLCGLLAVMALVAIIKGKRLGSKPDVVLAISAFGIIVFHFAIDQLKNQLIPFDLYRSNSFQFALTYTFIFTIISTNKIVSQKSKEAAIQAELDTAKFIQQDALTQKQPAFDNFPDIKLLASMDTAESVGGDFYDYFEMDKENVAFLIADVSGKGVPAAMFMMTAKNTIKAVAKTSTNPSQIMKQANDIISEHNDSMMFVTVWLGIYNTVSHILTYTNAGHNPPMLVSPDANYRLLDEVHGLVVGVDTSGAYTSSALTIDSRDRLFLYTDGLTEAHDSKGNLFKEENVARILKANPKMNNNELFDKMKSSVREFCKNTPQFDDITMMVVDFDYERDVSPDNVIDFIDGI